jgi:dihydropteroate synthase
MKYWQTSKRKLPLDKTLIVGILNTTPDSFSDGGNFVLVDKAMFKCEQMIAEGADIIDVGGESSRPNNSKRISVDEEIERVIPIIGQLSKRFDIPISIDTSKSEVAQAAVESGAEIINDISGFRFDEKLADVASHEKTGLILMHLRGNFETMHRQISAEDILTEVSNGFDWSLETAAKRGIEKDRIALDIGIGFSKTLEQNLELLSNLRVLREKYSDFALMVGTSRKSFIGKIFQNVETSERLSGSLSSASIAVWNGAKMVRVHDVKESVQAIRVVEALLSSAL